MEVLYENSNVGENLQDHILVPLGFEAAPGEATLESLRNETVLGQALAMYTVNHTGPLATGSVSTNSYVSYAQILDALGKGRWDWRATLLIYTLPTSRCPLHPLSASVKVHNRLSDSILISSSFAYIPQIPSSPTQQSTQSSKL